MALATGFIILEKQNYQRVLILKEKLGTAKGFQVSALVFFLLLASLEEELKFLVNTTEFSG